MTSDIKRRDKFSYKKLFSKKSVLQTSFTLTLNNVTAMSSNINLNMTNEYEKCKYEFKYEKSKCKWMTFFKLTSHFGTLRMKNSFIFKLTILTKYQRASFSALLITNLIKNLDITLMLNPKDKQLNN